MDTLGIVESKSIAAGVELADTMMKMADVELVRASTICAGRYIIYVSGDREAVATSVRAAQDSGHSLVGSFVISKVSHEVLSVLKKDVLVGEVDALGVVECRNVSSGVLAADISVKRSSILLVRIVSGQGINGKSYFVMSGDVSSIEEAVGAARSVLGKNFVEAAVIPRPDASLVRALIRGRGNI